MIPGNKDTRDGILFSLPFMIVFALFMIYPLVFGFYISFFQWNILGTPKFIALQNYLDLLKDERFWSSLWHTLQFVLMTTPVLLILGFIMALLVTGKSPLKGIMETCFFVPYIFSMTVVATLWAWIMQKDFGIINQILRILGKDGVSWLTSEKNAMHKADFKGNLRKRNSRWGRAFAADIPHNHTAIETDNDSMPYTAGHCVIQRLRTGVCDDGRRPRRFDKSAGAVYL